MTIQERGPAGLVLWLRKYQPAVYAQLVATVPEVADIEATIRQQEAGGLGWLANIGKAIAGFAKNAMPKLVSALPKIAATAVDVGSQVYVAKQQKKLIDSQIKQAELNQPPLQTAEVPGQLVQVRDPVTGAPMQQPAVRLTQRPTLIPGVPDPVTYIGGGLLALALLKRFRVL
jgi:hypothetical protein